MVKLVVGNLPPSATNQSLKELFYEYEDLQDYKLISNYGFVYLESEESAMHAVYNLNGIEYRGFLVTVDYVGDNRNKRKLPITSDPNQFQKPVAPLQSRPVPPQIEQGNTNPYNLTFTSANNSIPKPFEIAPEKRFGVQPPMLDTRNTNPYNLPYPSATKPDARSFNPMSDRRYAPQSYPEYHQDPMYGAMAYGFPPDYGYQQDYQYGAPAQCLGDFTEQYIPEEEYFANAPPQKRLRTNPFMDNEDHGYGPRRPFDFTGDNYRSFKGGQPQWFESRQMPMRPPFLHPRDEPFYRPRGKRGGFRPNKSYIDEYEDNRDYSDVDPYPAYLKQYQK